MIEEDHLQDLVTEAPQPVESAVVVIWKQVLHEMQTDLQVAMHIVISFAFNLEIQALQN